MFIILNRDNGCIRILYPNNNNNKITNNGICYNREKPKRCKSRLSLWKSGPSIPEDEVPWAK